MNVTDPPYVWPGSLTPEQKRDLEVIRARAAHYLSPPLHLHFTDHSLDHADRVVQQFLKLADAIRTREKQLSSLEMFVGLAACLLHDIGMHASLHVSREYVNNLSEMSLDEIRKIHGRECREQIKRSVRSERPVTDTDQEVWDLGLTHSQKLRDLASVIAEVAGNHSGLVDLSPASYVTPYGGQQIRVQFLLHLLRLADGLDIDSQRVDFVGLQKFRIPPESKLHWWQHHYVASVDIDPQANIRLLMRFPEGMSAPYIDYFSRRMYDYVMKEIRLGEEVYRDNDLYPRLKPIETTTELSDAKRPVPQDLAEYLDRIIKPERRPASTDFVVRNPATDRASQIMDKWGIRGNPWVDLPAAFGSNEFVMTEDLEYKLSQIESLAQDERGELRILFGARGGGKSSFLHSVHEHLRNRCYPSYHDVGDAGISKLSTPQQLHVWLFRAIFADLAQRHPPEEGPKSADFNQLLGKFQGRKPVILVDNLDRYSEKPEQAVLKRFFQLSQGNFAALKRSALILISASDEWADFLSAEDLNYIGARSFWNLEPFAAMDVKRLMENRLEIAGSSYDRVFSPQCYELVHKLARGNPREVVQVCGALHDYALKNGYDVIDTRAVEAVFGKQLENRVVKKVVQMCKESPACKIFLDGLFSYHRVVERTGVKADTAWNLIAILLNEEKLEHESVPQELSHTLPRIATVRSKLNGNRQEMYWELRSEGKMFVEQLHQGEIDLAEFVQVYRINPIPPPGGPADDILDTIKPGEVEPEVLRQLSTARDLIVDLTEKPNLSPVQVLLKARFALEHLLVAFLLTNKVALPANYIYDHDQGHFVAASGVSRQKYPSVLVRELADLLKEFKSAHGGFVDTWREMMIIDRKARLYLTRQDGATLFNQNDVIEMRGCIRKIYEEVAPLATGKAKPQKFERKRRPSRSRSSPRQVKGAWKKRPPRRE